MYFQMIEIQKIFYKNIHLQYNKKKERFLVLLPADQNFNKIIVKNFAKNRIFLLSKK